MQKCTTTDFELKVPDDWLDRSMISWMAPPKEGEKIHPNVLCGKGELLGNENLDQFVNRQMKDALNRLPDFIITRREAVKLRGRDAVDLEFTATINASTIRQRQIYFITGKAKKTVSTIVITASEKGFDQEKQLFQSILSSIEYYD